MEEVGCTRCNLASTHLSRPLQSNIVSASTHTHTLPSLSLPTAQQVEDEPAADAEAEEALPAEVPLAATQPTEDEPAEEAPAATQIAVTQPAEEAPASQPPAAAEPAPEPAAEPASAKKALPVLKRKPMLVGAGCRLWLGAQLALPACIATC